MIVDPRHFWDFLAASGGFGLGSVLAIVLSWDRNRSILLAVIHAFFGWLYVLWFALTRSSRPPQF
jgi:hypothetical protein